MPEKDFLMGMTFKFIFICSTFIVNCAISVKRADAAYNSPVLGLPSAQGISCSRGLTVFMAENHAFYALRSCHRLLHEVSAEFFSPDYLCSNPQLWCNWTIQVHPGMRIRLRLEDYTPADACYLKQDQIHLDESPGSGRHRTLEGCWRDVEYTSDSNTLYVILLIGASQQPTYRGFYARYQAFSPPHYTPPHHSHAGRNRDWGGEGKENLLVDNDDDDDDDEKPVMEQAKRVHDPVLSSTVDPSSLKTDSVTRYPSSEQTLVPKPAEPQPTGPNGSLTKATAASRLHTGENVNPDLTKEADGTPKPESEKTWNDIKSPSDTDGGTGGSKKGDQYKETRTNTSSIEDGDQGQSDKATPLSPVERPSELLDQDPTAGPIHKKPTPPFASSSSPPTMAQTRTLLGDQSSAPQPALQERMPSDKNSSKSGSRNVRKLQVDWNEDAGPGRPPLDDDDPLAYPVEKQVVKNTREDPTKPSAPTLSGWHPNTVEHVPEDGLREKANSFRYLRNGSVRVVLPGEHQFEVSVEVLLKSSVNDSWDHMARLLMSSLQNMIRDEITSRLPLKSISPIRIKRLTSGVLYIFWLQSEGGRESADAQRYLETGLKRLRFRPVDTRGRQYQASVGYAYSEDVNECGTQQVLCDMNAECINRFGSYACRCKPGYEDKSRLGSGGTVCVGPPAPGLSSPSHPSSPSAMLNFLYSLCFLLGFFVILLLCVVGTLYRRYHRGAFLVPCSNRGSHEGCDVNDVASVTQNGSQPAPPPPPIRRPRDGWGNPKDRCPSTDLPLLKFSPLVPPEDQTHVEKEEGNQQ